MQIDRQLLEFRASNPLSIEPRPFLKWAGSKRLLTSHLADFIPDTIGRYYEPFLGSGALFFLLQPRRATLSDSCPELIQTYHGIAKSHELVASCLGKWKPDEESYYKLRATQPKNEARIAARMLYLNKLCWNGLYRVNSQGQFNVPYGRPKSDNIVDASNLAACAFALSQPDIKILNVDFEVALKGARSGDFVFLDPPYVTTHNNNGFLAYNERIFSWADQQRLARVARRMANRGVHVLVTNALHPDVTDLYRGFAIKQIERSSTLASNKSRRGRVSEAVIYNPGGLPVGEAR